MFEINKLKNLLFYAAIIFGMIACDSYPSGVPEVENVTISLSNVYPRNGEEISTRLVGNLDDFVSVAWDFGDGTTSNDAATTKKYTKDGVYRISVTYQTKSSEVISKWIMVKVSGQALSEAIKSLEANPSKVWVMAHRGNTENKTIPENSLRAMEASIAAKVDVMEIDTHITKDGVVMVCHDETIDRTTTGRGKIPELTFDQIRSYKLRDRNGNATNDVMPTLQEMLEAGRGRIFFNLDYSPRTASTEQVYKVVQDCGMIEGVFFYTGSINSYMKDLFSMNKNCHPYAWGGSQTNYEPSQNRGRKFFVQLDFKDVGSNAQATCLRNGMLLSFNVLSADFEDPFQSGDYRIVESLINAPARMIQTDIPLGLIKYLEEKGYR